MTDPARSDGAARVDEERLATRAHQPRAADARGSADLPDQQRRGGPAGAAVAPGGRRLSDRQPGRARRQGTGNAARPADPRLSAAGETRPGRDGHRLQGPAGEHESAGGRQGAASAAGRQSGVLATADARGPPGRATQSQQHHPGHRCRLGRAVALLRHGACRRPAHPGNFGCRQGVRGARGGRDHLADRSGARSTPIAAA